MPFIFWGVFNGFTNIPAILNCPFLINKNDRHETGVGKRSACTDTGQRRLEGVLLRVDSEFFHLTV